MLFFLVLDIHGCVQVSSCSGVVKHKAILLLHLDSWYLSVDYLPFFQLIIGL